MEAAPPPLFSLCRIYGALCVEVTLGLENEVSAIPEAGLDLWYPMAAASVLEGFPRQGTSLVFANHNTIPSQSIMQQALSLMRDSLFQGIVRQNGIM